MTQRFQETDNLLPYQGELYLIRGFYPAELADRYLAQLLTEIAWQSEQLRLYGRWLTVPRLMAWYGDAGSRYRYSGVIHHPLPWTPLLQTIRQDMQHSCAHRFNSVLANLYRDGRDSMGCHADDERELGLNPSIASLSLGDSRVLRFRHPATAFKINIELKHGDLLWMTGCIQHHWRHELPKTRKPKQARINLTFRQIHELYSRPL